MGHGMSLDVAAVVIAAGMLLTGIALVMVFGGFFAERRLRDRLEDLDARTGRGPRTIQMAPARRVGTSGGRQTRAERRGRVERGARVT